MNFYFSGTVGTPLPGVEVRITKSEAQSGSDTAVLVHGTSEKSNVVLKSSDPVSGDLQIKGPTVFKEYWKRPDVTAKSFTSDGWFKTGNFFKIKLKSKKADNLKKIFLLLGDTVQYENGIYKILGRTSIDIIKSGGYKVSALEVETVILGHPDIIDCAVVGISDSTWGQKV